MIKQIIVDYAIWQAITDLESRCRHRSSGLQIEIEDKEPIFEQMRLAGMPPTEKIPSAKFWAMAKKLISQDGFFDMPQIERAVECVGC